MGYRDGVGMEGDDPFVEIELTSGGSSYPSAAVAPVRPLDAVSGEDPNDVAAKRAVFYAMRQIARDAIVFEADLPRAFALQARFMMDFEDDDPSREVFTAYYPTYQMMNYAQLRTYFSWRTQVRQGNVDGVSVSYAFLYLYELINGLGVSDPQDGLDRMMAFWKAFRVFDPTIDRYVVQWMKDYHIYYPLERPFPDFAVEHGLQSFYPTIFGYESGREDSLDLFAGIARYPIKRSVFYTEENRELVGDCFYWILSRLREQCRTKKKVFEDLVFFPLER